MNWTGGGLSRHSRNARASIVQRQKQHFAKARSSLLNGNFKKSPIKWSLFEHVELNPSVDQSQRASNSRSQSRNKQSNTQSDLSPLRVLYNNSGNGISLQVPQHHSGRHDVSLTKYKDDLSGNLEIENPLHFKKAPIWQAISSGHQSDNSEINGRPSKENNRSLEERRRLILCKGDWVGANIQRPIKLRYAGTINDGRIGKRRRIGSDDQTPFSAMRQSTNCNVLNVQKERAGPKPDIYDNINAVPHTVWANDAKSRVRISIGGKQVHAGADSNCTNHIMSSQASMSDVMLLDGDDVSRKFVRASEDLQEKYVGDGLNVIDCDRPSRPSMNNIFNTPHRQQITSSNASSRSRIQSDSHDIQREQVPRVCDAEDDSLSSVVFGRESEIDHTLSHPSQVGLQFAGIERPYEIRHMDGEIEQMINLGDEVESSSMSGRFISDVSRQISESARKLQSKARDKARRHRHLSPRPQLFHPMPQTLRTAHVLHSPPSEDMGSTTAQIGAAKPVVTSSQELEEQIWKTWILPLDNDIELDKFEEDDGKPNRISPGVSTIIYPPVRENVGQGIEENDQHDNHPREVGKEDVAAVEFDIESFGKGEYHTRSTERSQLDLQDKRPTIEAFDYKNIFKQPPKRIVSHMKTKMRNNPDDAWVKFILSDSDEDDDKFLEDNPQDHGPTLLGTPVKHDNNSMIAHTSDEALSASQFQISRTPNGIRKAIGQHDISSKPTATAPTKHDYVSSNSELGPTLSSDSIPLINSQPSNITFNKKRETSQLPPVTPPTHRIIFTRPQRYTGCSRAKNDPEAISNAERFVTHIGSTLNIRDGKKHGGMERDGEVRDAKERRHVGTSPLSRKVKPRDVYSLESVSEAENDEEENDEIDDSISSSGD